MISHIGTMVTQTPYPSHQHPCYEISYIHEGEGYMQTDAGNIPFTAGTIFVIPPKLNHMLFSDRGHIATSMLSRSEHLTPIRHITAARDNGIREAESIVRIMSARGDSLSEYLQCLGKAFIMLVLELMDIDEIGYAHTDTVEQIIAKINKHFSDPEFKVKTALRESPYAEDYIRGIFKEQTGMTPNRMLTKTRLKHAENIILYSTAERSIASIAHESGFDDLAYFSKVFKKEYGSSPLEYKKEKGKKLPLSREKN